MQINHISSCEPRKLTSFKSSTLKEDSGKKVRYKHYYEMPEEDLKVYSMLKAYDSVQKSGKMRLKEALPALSTIALGTSFALAQPGKFSTKTKAGLGFLALTTAASSLIGFVHKKIDDHYKNKNEENSDTEKKSLLKVGAFFASVAAVYAAASLISKKGILPESSKIAKFLEKEKTTLANELNSTKVGKFIENKLNPFFEKHEKLTGIVSTVLPFGVFAGSLVANNKMNESLSKDLVELTKKNYIKGKIAQADARAHFDSVDAIEV